MSNHPYPDHVRQAVATTIAQQVLFMRKWDDLNWQTKDAFLSDADQVLNTLWDASRVDSVEQLEKLPRDVALIDCHGRVESDYVGTNNIDARDLPAYVLHWGDTDEQAAGY